MDRRTTPPHRQRQGPSRPRSQISTASSEKAEKVVKPPRIPVVRNSRSGWLQPSPALKASHPAKSPMMKEPTTLTVSVPQGNAVPQYARAADIHAMPRAPPIPAPRKTMSKPIIGPVSSSRSALAPQPRPPVQALPDLALEAPIHRLVEVLPPELLRPVILPREGVRLVVVVAVALAVADLLHELRRRVQDRLRAA